MTSQTRRRYVCNLSEKSLEKARQELNEDPETREEKIDELRAKFAKEKPEVKLPPDDAFLVRFLRNNKFDVQKAYDMLLHHYEVRRKYKELFVNYQPSFYKQVYETDMLTICPGRDKDGSTVVLFKVGKLDLDRYSFDFVTTGFLIAFDKLLEDEEIQVNGVVTVEDYEDVSIKLMTKCGSSDSKKMMDVFVNPMPIRFKAGHYIRQPDFFGTVFDLFKPFLTDKLAKRFHFHGKDYGTLHDYVPSSMLPSDFGGKLTNYNSQEWFEELCKEDKKFEEQNQYGFPKAADVSGDVSQGAGQVGGSAESFEKA
ncbi:alpha-tocopherol transfer protein-like isoform X2 [Ptychodera flava]|uniref:alpha-tocopherol transfer protein-like isoform X1 n=1 Tax=Ptychodera flava TaxID=63121 RepID=UPI003969C4C9